MIHVRDVQLGSTRERMLPTAIAVAKAGGAMRFGIDAIEAPTSEYDLLVNWKLLLGKSRAEIQRERANNAALRNSLELMPIERVVAAYLESVLNTAKSQLGLIDQPQLIVGIPVLSGEGAASWRSQSKRMIEAALAIAGCPKPAFFPEPFAVFQYHRNRGDIPEGKLQNVLVLDIGGGTTNVCIIQTTQHGRLARGGANHIPRAVKAIEVGGVDIDRWILESVEGESKATPSPSALLSASRAKELLSSVANDRSGWENDIQLSFISTGVRTSAGVEVPFSASDLKKVVINRFWPSVHAVVLESLQQVITSERFANPVQNLDAVIYAGGTCQMLLVPQLFSQAFRDHPLLSGPRIDIVSPDYRSAVAHGLAIEAQANRSYEIRPSRVAPYLQDHLQFCVSHRRDNIEPPHNLRGRGTPLSNRLGEGILVEAPQSVGNLAELAPEWSFRLVQNPEQIYYSFRKVDPATNAPSEDFLPVTGRLPVAKRGSRAGRNVIVKLAVREDGFADVRFTTRMSEIGEVIHEGAPFDLHDLSGIAGSLFMGLDLGSSTTLAAFVNGADAFEADVIPTRYAFDRQVRDRAIALDTRAREIVRDPKVPAELPNWNREILKDYVYHSNRIEGSSLSRGQTSEILDSVAENPLASAIAIRHRLEEIAYLDDAGEVRTATRPVRDQEAAVNLRDAFKLVEEWAADPNFALTAFFLRQLHGLVTRGDDSAAPGVYRKSAVRIEQTTFVPPDYMHVPDLVEQLFVEISRPDFQNLPSLLQSVEFHTRFVSIHPFSDGNGRVARLLVNYGSSGDRVGGKPGSERRKHA